MAQPTLAGTFTALVTPFSPDSENVDYAALEALVERQIVGGVTGLVPCGTTGEAPTLTESEQAQVIARTVAVTKGRVPVFAGTGTFSTKKTIEASKRALEAGADGVMVVMPYYNKPTQEGLFQHLSKVAASVDCPIILYNIPGRTQSDLAPETTERLCAAAPNIVGMKEATGNVLRAQELKRRLGDRLVVLSGDDGLTLAMMAVGAAGVISVTSNLLPEQVSRVTKDILDNKWQSARERHLRLVPVHESMFIEANPSPIKAAMAMKGWMSDSVRLPLVPATEATKVKLKAVLATLENQA